MIFHRGRYWTLDYWDNLLRRASVILINYVQGKRKIGCSMYAKIRILQIYQFINPYIQSCKMHID